MEGRNYRVHGFDCSVTNSMSQKPKFEKPEK